MAVVVDEKVVVTEVSSFCPEGLAVATLAIESADFPRAEGGELKQKGKISITTNQLILQYLQGRSNIQMIKTYHQSKTNASWTRSLTH